NKEAQKKGPVFRFCLLAQPDIFILLLVQAGCAKKLHHAHDTIQRSTFNKTQDRKKVVRLAWGIPKLNAQSQISLLPDFIMIIYFLI
ncbi:MAG: hypothetical protein ABR533_09620, partial [Desulfonatronovibrio sp.]